jgi:hypothetical protein
MRACCLTEVRALLPIASTLTFRALLWRCTAEGDELKQAIMLQIEYYLSRENLARDTFLVNQMNAEAYAPISLIAGFSKMKSFTTDMAVIMEAIKLSKKLEVDEAGTSVRPTDMELDGKKKTTIILREVAADVPEEQVRELFDEATFGPIAKIRSDVGGFWFIEMENEISSDLLDKIREKQINGAYVKARLKTESAARTMFGASPTGAVSPEGSPTAMSAAQAAAAQYGYYPGYNQAYAGYAPQMYYPQAAGRGAAPGSWGYMAWDPSMQQAPVGPGGQPGAYPAQGRGAGGFPAAAGRGRAAGGRGDGGRGGGLARGATGAGRGAARGGKSTVGAPAPAAGGAAPVPAASGNGGAPATSKAAKKKAGTPKASSPKKADDLRPESLSLGSAMDFPSLPGTPTAGRTASKTSEPEDAPAITKPEGMDDSIEAAEPVPAPAPAPAAAGGWAQVAKKGTPRAAGDAPAVKVPVPAAEPALSQQGQEGGAGGGAAKAESGEGAASKPASAQAPAPAPAPTPAPAAAAETPAPVDAPSVEPAPADGKVSWAQMAKARASEAVKQAPVVKQPKAADAPPMVRPCCQLVFSARCLMPHRQSEPPSVHRVLILAYLRVLLAILCSFIDLPHQQRRDRGERSPTAAPSPMSDTWAGKGSKASLSSSGDFGNDLGNARNAEIADVWNDGDEAMNRHGKKDEAADAAGGSTSPSKKTYAQMAAESAARGAAKRAPIHDNVDAWAGE